MRKSPQNLAHTQSPGNISLRNKEANSGRDFNPLVDIHFENLNADTIGLRGIDTGSGVRVMRIPYWLGQRGMQSVYIDDNWTVDLGTSSIDQVTFTGGLVDGISFAASTDYCLFAFFDPFDPENNKFKGFGVTTRPQTTASAVSSGTRGSVGTFTVPSPGANRFNVGARVICRVGINIGDDYNQGTVTEIESATSIKIKLDSTYGAIAETNTDLSGSGIDIIQTNFFAPKLDNSENTVYPGNGVQYSYKFIGLIQTDANIEIINFARAGQWIYLHPFILHFSKSSQTTSSTETTCLSRIIPVSTNKLLGVFIVTVNSGTTGHAILLINSGSHEQITSDRIRRSATGNIANQDQQYYECDINLSNNSILHNITIVSNQNATYSNFIRGYTLYE